MRPTNAAMKERIQRQIAIENEREAFRRLPQSLLDAPVDVADLNHTYLRLVADARKNLRSTSLRLASEFTPCEEAIPFGTLRQMRYDAARDAEALVRADAPESIVDIARKIVRYFDRVMRIAVQQLDPAEGGEVTA